MGRYPSPSGNTWKDWKRSLCYGGIVFLSFSFLYTEPYWSMMVDQAVALWAGALIAWGLSPDRGRALGASRGLPADHRHDEVPGKGRCSL